MLSIWVSNSISESESESKYESNSEYIYTFNKQNNVKAPKL